MAGVKRPGPTRNRDVPPMGRWLSSTHACQYQAFLKWRYRACHHRMLVTAVCWPPLASRGHAQGHASHRRTFDLRPQGARRKPQTRFSPLTPPVEQLKSELGSMKKFRLSAARDTSCDTIVVRCDNSSERSLNFNSPSKCIRQNLSPAVTNARCCAHRAARARIPLDDARSLAKTARSFTTGTEFGATAAGFRCGSGGALRSTPFQRLSVSLHCSRSPTADRSVSNRKRN